MYILHITHYIATCIRQHLEAITACFTLPPPTFGTRGYAAMESNCSVLVSDNSSGFITGQLSWHHIFEEAHRFV